ncbi:glutathione S-transferase family protein [Tianweitania sediminis]|uniref:Glutathione S-transferase family protein n=1 Tax=Tianweitania sediminis TaxID=1502156 RepID=A0A8J7R4U5_9HYPH|nr:glutathione S-transferase family protein [Tianweitania sediminis]MBP0439780.1 glutathione S-transferase family protein [Tianweitania sediminis]
MMDKITLYTNPMSRGRIARWMLEEVGEPYDTHLVQYGAPMKGEYRSINPMGKVPAVVHGSKVITECAAICAYLADAFPEAGLAPEPADRADYYRWMFFAAGPLESAVTNRSLGVQVPDEKRGFVGYGSYEEVIDTLEKAVEGRSFIAGDRFTAADVYLGSHIGFGLSFGSFEKRPAFVAYHERLKERLAFKRANELDDAAMPAQP